MAEIKIFYIAKKILDKPPLPGYLVGKLRLSRASEERKNDGPEENG